MCNPVVREATKAGCRFQFGAKVSEAMVKEGKMIGVRMENGQEHRAAQTVIASTLQDAKKILAPLKGRSELARLYALPVMSACCLQLELDQPALEKVSRFSARVPIWSALQSSHVQHFKPQKAGCRSFWAIQRNTVKKVSRIF